MAAVRMAVMEIGAQDVIMKVYEIAPRKGMQVIDSLRRMVPVGKDTYSEGRISTQVLEQICNAFTHFKQTLAEYGITEYYALANSAVREAKNCAMVVDQIEVRTGIRVRVLSNSEQRYVRIKGVIARENDFKLPEKGTAMVDIGAGSLQISIYEKKALATTQNIRLGMAKIGEMFSAFSWEYPVVELVLKEMIDNDVQTFEKMFLKDHTIRSLILVGDTLISQIRKVLEHTGDPGITAEDIRKLYSQIRGKSTSEISQMLDMPFEYAAMVLPVMILAQTLLDASQAERIWIPQSDLCDGYAIDYMEKHKLGRITYNFEEDIIASTKTICKRYKGNQAHAEYLEQMAGKFFDLLQKYHGLGERERLLLRLAAILHDCGKFISMSAPGECAYQIIMSTEILGISHMEREMVASIVRYNTMELPNFREFDGKLGNDEYLIVMKLAAILRVCNALDRSHRQKFADMKLTIKDSNIVITTAYPDNITLEKKTLQDKQDFFEEVYGLGFEIKQKKKKQ